MKLKIMQTGTPVLREKARPLSVEEIKSDAISQLILLMKETMHDAPGVGLAAPQIGLPLQLAVIEDRQEYLQQFSPNELRDKKRSAVPFHVIINPVLTIKQNEEEVEHFEGCLSLTGLVGLIPRALSVQVNCLNELGEPIIIDANGWYARILQHEIDHLHGTLCIDRMKLDTLTTIENYNKFWKVQKRN